MRNFAAGLVLGLIILPVALTLYLYYGHVPVAVTDAALPREEALVDVPLHARIDKEMPRSAPIEASTANLLSGAVVYREQCAACHGLYGRTSSFADHMYPDAPQLWAPHNHPGAAPVVGVSDDPPGETFWKVKNGIRLSGMPAYAEVLNATQMWQVTILLANADKPLPAEVLALLKQPLIPSPEAPHAAHPDETHLPASALANPPAE